MYAPNGLNYTVKEEAMADPRMNELYNTMMNDWYEYAGTNSLYNGHGSECYPTPKQRLLGIAPARFGFGQPEVGTRS